MLTDYEKENAKKILEAWDWLVSSPSSGSLRDVLERIEALEEFGLRLPVEVSIGL